MDSFIVVFTNRLNIGLAATAYHAKFHENSPIELLEHVTPEHIQKNGSAYNDDEKEIVALLNTISDKELFKKFSREDSLRNFKNNIPPKLLSERIRPHIEEKMYQLVLMLSQSKTEAYFKQSGYSNLYSTDKLKIPSTPCKPVFRVDIEGDEMHYGLRFKQGGENFTFHNKEVEIICNDPAVLKSGQRIFFFSNFDSGKLKPFREKEYIHLKGARVIDTYMEKFISNVVELFDVQGSGFDIQNIEDRPSTELHLEKNLALQSVLRFRFTYGHRTVSPNRKTSVFVDLLKENGRYIFRRFPRDFETEQNVFALLEKNGLIVSEDFSFMHPADKQNNTPAGPENLIEWVRDHKELLDQNNIKPVLQFDEKAFNIAPAKLTFESGTEDPDWFDLKSVVEIPPFRIPFVKFRKNILNNDQHFKLPDGTIFIIPREWFTRYTDLFNFGQTDKENLKLPKTYYHLLEELKNEKIAGIATPELPQISEYETMPLPDGLKAQLRPYQIEGFQWMEFLKKNNFGGILADDMGLGKTLQTITLLLNTYQSNKNQSIPDPAGQMSLFDSHIDGFNQSGLPPSLIVMPTSLVHNWDNEIKKFAPSLKTYIYTGSNRARSKELWKILRHYHVVITTYGILRNDVEYFTQMPWKYLILDESQNIKNPSSKGYEAVSQIKASHYLALTGTPIENSLTDLWAQMNIVNHGILKSLGFFKKYYETPITKNGDEEKEAHLQKIINPYLLRRTKEMVAKDLPPIMEQVVYCDMSSEQKKIYDREKSGIRNNLLQSFDSMRQNEQAIMALQALTRLRQLANHPAMTDPDYQGSSGKFDQIIESLENIISEHHHVLIFSSFVKDLELLEAELKNRKIEYAKLTGSTQKRDKVIDRFNKDDNVKVFLISLKAGGVGLNLTKADYVFMLNPWWNPAAEAQAINRAHRIGQTRNVFVYRFISTETIEEKIALLQEKKNKLAAAFVNTTNPLSQMSADEIKELFN
ncbi:helicase-like protein [Marinilabilia salmonicolor]|jgi:SNF2 family DNA or RNA helicase|uniref:DEAD/DEAH box helicase n=1 Tax=Marinilabilia salmonicolor TaxID=989 RepID=UPI000D0764B8|nr:DEAD/DEAH box helicase [Marinilabilia salmonicolor]PRZ01048.1 helicase-like protein [Marinilabilia salmonicolor]